MPYIDIKKGQVVNLTLTGYSYSCYPIKCGGIFIDTENYDLYAKNYDDVDNNF